MSEALRIVTTSDAHELEEIPRFEGQRVSFTAAKLTNLSRLEVGDGVFRVDDVVELVVQCRVLSVDHKVNETTGQLGRVHLLKAIDSAITPRRTP